jgi:hypothetical protein
MKRLVLALTLAICGTLPTWGSDGHATHPFDPPQLLQGIHPNPYGVAWYSLCTSSVPLSWLWAWGPESWEDATEALGGPAYFTVSATQCSSNVQEQVQWEYLNYSCLPEQFGCHILLNYSQHSSSGVGNHYHVSRAAIVFDYSDWNEPPTTDDLRRAASAHETGHGVGLDDEEGTICQEHSIMGQGCIPPEHQAPTYWDTISGMATNGYFD